MVGDWEHALAESGSPVRMPELGLRSDFLSGPTLQGRTMNVLFVTESERGCWQLVSRIEALGCRYWFASNPAEIRRIIEFCDIGLVLSTRPVTEGRQLLVVPSDTGGGTPAHLGNSAERVYEHLR